MGKVFTHKTRVRLFTLNLSTQFLLALVLASCAGPANQSSPVLQRLNRGSDSPENVDYVVSLATQAEAREHQKSLERSGAQSESLDASGRVLHVKATPSQLSSVRISDRSLIHSNTTLRVIPQLRNGPMLKNARPTAESQIDSQDLFMARKVVGVDALALRHPEADGRAVKVAIFDTGIDFGVEGIEKQQNGEQKLLGFYDFTHFGRVKATLLSSEIPLSVYTIGEKSISVSGEAVPQKIQASGLLSEKELAKNYALADGLDLNNNGRSDDNFAYLVGVNANGLPAVWIDLNQDGNIQTDREELTDYNRTHKFLDSNMTSAPSGARPLAVTINSSEDLQFHTVPEGHGTGCATIVSADHFANGRLIGMAPQSKLLSYTLDASGQDIYTLDQFLKMFLHAKDQGADLISISWGFSTADLDSARFVADFLDSEIASAGIVIAIAAGNEGPGFSSAGPTDYIPHNGFGVGAYVSKDQARNLYGWTGTLEDSIVWYSSFGPTKGGRAIPDISSPLMSLVRHNRVTEGPQFYPFSGTSSATPAFVGATASLISALRANSGITKIDVRLLKLALQNSAKPLARVEALRQGPGLVDVNAAYDIYLKLAQELQSANADNSRRQAFAYELRANTLLQREGIYGEGIHVLGVATNAEVNVRVVPSSAALLDPLLFVEPLRLKTHQNFLQGPDQVLLQADGAKFSLQFNPAKLRRPGIYSDVITLNRVSDDLVLLRIPVVVEIPYTVGTSVEFTKVDKEMHPFDVVRIPVQLTKSGEIHFEGIIQEVAASGRGNSLALYIRSLDGLHVYEKLAKQERNMQMLSFRSETLPPGSYEAIFFRNFAKAAVLSTISLQGSLRQSYSSLVASDVSTSEASFVMTANDNLNVASSELVLLGNRSEFTLTKDLNSDPIAFKGEVSLPRASADLELNLEQSNFDRVSDSLFSTEIILSDLNTGPLYRGWLNVQAAGSPLQAATLNTAVQSFKVLAYPNIVKWDSIQTRQLKLVVGNRLANEVKIPTRTDKTAFGQGENFRVSLDLPESSPLQVGAYGLWRFYDAESKLVDEVPVRF